jgi:hypothetical protein
VTAYAIVVQLVCANAPYANMKKQKLTTTVPPKKGPVSQGLKINSKKIQIVKTNK